MPKLEFLLHVAMVTMLVFLLIPSMRTIDRSHVDTRTTYNRMAVWLSAGDEFEKQKGRQLASIDELENFVFSGKCRYCDDPHARVDWWGTPPRIWIEPDDSRRHPAKVLYVQSAGSDHQFDDLNQTRSTTIGHLMGQ